MGNTVASIAKTGAKHINPVNPIPSIITGGIVFLIGFIYSIVFMSKRNWKGFKYSQNVSNDPKTPKYVEKVSSGGTFFAILLLVVACLAAICAHIVYTIMFDIANPKAAAALFIASAVSDDMRMA